MSELGTTPAELSKMTKMQKLATLLVILGPESAAEMMRHLTEQELEVVAGEMAKTGFISQQVQREIFKEFTEVVVEASGALHGGVGCAQTALERSVGLYRAADIINRVAPSRPTVPSMEEIMKMDGRHVYNLLRHEQPQTVALILSYLPPDKSSQVMLHFTPDQRDRVLERLATLAPTPIEVVEKVVDVLNQKMGTNHTRALSQTGGVKAAADLLNSMDKDVSKSVLTQLEERNPELAGSIRQKMFTFDDLADLESSILQKIMRETDMRDLALALKTANERLRTVLLSCISRRAAETVTEEMSFLGPLKLRDIEGARGRIIEIVRRLEEEGEIELGTNEEEILDEAIA